MRNLWQKIKEVCFVIAGGILGLSTLPFTQTVNTDWKYVLIISIGLILIGVGILDGLVNFSVKLIRLWNNLRKKVALISPYEIGGDKSSWVGISIQDIEEKLKQDKKNFTKIENTRNIDHFPIIINPYGGTYPEESIEKLTSISKIFDYVRSGGIFINVADIPFYYAYEKNLGRRIDTTPLVNGLSNMRSFADSLVARNLHIFVIGIDPPQKNVSRVFTYPSNAINYYSRFIRIKKTKYTPYLGIPYGKGYFIFSTIPLNSKKQMGILVERALDLLN